MTHITMNDGHTIPSVGFGVFMITDPELCKKSILTALDLGCRHFDTAQIYQNEHMVGDALSSSEVPREDLFITTKIWPSNFGYERCKASIEKSLKRLKTDYIDLVLLHRPYGNYKGAWKALEEAVQKGKIKSIGLSNFTIAQTQKILDACEIMPVVNQVECHPYEQQTELRAYLDSKNIKIQAWFPIGHGDKNLLMEPIFTALARKYNQSNVQIILRWHLQMGNIIFPKSTNPDHIKSNMDLFDFELTEDEMKEIAKLDKHQPLFTQPDWLMNLMSKFDRFRDI